MCWKESVICTVCVCALVLILLIWMNIIAQDVWGMHLGTFVFILSNRGNAY